MVPYEPASAQFHQSQVVSSAQPPASDILARLQTLPIEDVETTLSHRYRKSDPGCSLLSYLRTPEDGFTQAQAAARVLEELADGVEDVSTTTSLVVRYVQAHRLWTDHPNPAVNSLETLLGTVDGIQYVQAGTVIGTSSQLMRARAIRLIEKHWGPDWFEKIPAEMKDSTWSRAADCSHQLLRLIAANAKQGVGLEAAKSAWAQSIRRRRDERVRKELRMRCPRSPFIITDDVRSVGETLGLSQQSRRTSEIVYADEPAEDQLRVELVSPGSKRGARSTREPGADGLGSRKRQRRPQKETGVGGWRVSDDGLWKRKRDGNQLVRVPLAGGDDSYPSSELFSADSRAGTPRAADDVTESGVGVTGLAACDGPAIATNLRRIVATLASHDGEDPAAVKLAGRCCTPCRAKIDVLDEMVSGAMRVASLLENLAGHQAITAAAGVVDPPPSESVPPTPRLPRAHRWWLPIDDESADE